jgi:hypothetical protein
MFGMNYKYAIYEAQFDDGTTAGLHFEFSIVDRLSVREWDSIPGQKFEKRWIGFFSQFRWSAHGFGLTERPKEGKRNGSGLVNPGLTPSGHFIGHQIASNSSILLLFVFCIDLNRNIRGLQA